MTILLSDAGKRFNREWIFRHFTYQFETGQSYVITGPNGSGKSTLLQVLSGGMSVSEGSIQFSGVPAVGSQQASISLDIVYKHISYCAPYLELVEEMTLKEFLDFHQRFKAFLPGISSDFIISFVGLTKAADKQIRYYSSGMKQRVKLGQCIFSDTPVVLLDEPCTNLDEEGVGLYERLVNNYCQDRMVIVSSNDATEYAFCQHRIQVLDYK